MPVSTARVTNSRALSSGDCVARRDRVNSAAAVNANNNSVWPHWNAASGKRLW